MPPCTLRSPRRSLATLSRQQLRRSSAGRLRAARPLAPRPGAPSSDEAAPRSTAAARSASRRRHERLAAAVTRSRRTRASAPAADSVFFARAHGQARSSRRRRGARGARSALAVLLSRPTEVDGGCRCRASGSARQGAAAGRPSRGLAAPPAPRRPGRVVIACCGRRRSRGEAGPSTMTFRSRRARAPLRAKRNARCSTRRGTLPSRDALGQRAPSTLGGAGVNAVSTPRAACTRRRDDRARRQGRESAPGLAARRRPTARQRDHHLEALSPERAPRVRRAAPRNRASPSADGPPTRGRESAPTAAPNRASRTATHGDRRDPSANGKAARSSRTARGRCGDSGGGARERPQPGRPRLDRPEAARATSPST